VFVSARTPYPGEGTFITAADLTPEHFGWYISVHVDDGPLQRRAMELKGIRGPWEYKGVSKIALVAVDRGGPFAGIEHHFSPDTKVELVQPLTAKAKRLARAKVAP
jgi:hypothetical protein